MSPIVGLPNPESSLTDLVRSLIGGTAITVESASDRAIALLGSKSGVDMKTAASTTIFTSKEARKTRITHVVVRDYSASLAGGTSYAITSFRSGFSLNGLTTANTGYGLVLPVDVTEYTEIAAGTAVQLTVTTGSTAACTATVDVFGFTT